MNSNKNLSDLLDVFVQQIAKTSALVPQTGLMNGKIGIAILLYHYARYKNESEITEYADQLFDLAAHEIGLDFGTSLDDGLCGIAWGLDYLIKQNFVQADDDILEEIDDALFSSNRTLYLFDLGLESDKGLYLWSRLRFCESFAKNIWQKRMETCINHLRDVVMLKYVWHEVPIFPCKTLIRFFHICQKFREHSQFRPKIDAIYEELSEIVKVSYREEKSSSDKYLLASMFSEIPLLKKCISTDNIPQSFQLKDVNNFYLTRLILGQNISIPKIIDKMLLSITEDHQQMDELLNQLNPDNGGLESDICGLAWAMLQWRIDR